MNRSSIQTNDGGNEVRRTSVLFGDATFVDDGKKSSKRASRTLDKMIAFPRFWFSFRYLLPFIAPLLFISTFLWPYIFVNKTDGFLFCGGVLSIIFCSIAIISYFHIKPWQRHPSPLIMQICLMSMCISIIFVVNTVPFGRVGDMSDGGEMNMAGSDYDDSRDGSIACIAMSLVMQVALLAREAWILTLSVDLVTSISNPFSSHIASQRKYHIFVWLGALTLAIILANHRQCQGELLSNGTCWIKIDGIQSTCFWGYFFSWMILFYFNSATVLFYAYTRISNGLESTYATRYACVADTFRVVFFYFSYGLMLAVLLLILYYAHVGNDKKSNARFIQHLVAYLVASRGFFDALVWFFTHGFICSNDSVTGFALNSRLLLNKKLTMRDIFQPKFLLNKMYETWKKALQNRESVSTAQNTEQLSSLLVPSEEAPLNYLPFNQERIFEGDDDEEGNFEANGVNTTSRSTSSRMPPMAMDFDVSPQLNLALRKEVLDLVTMGIKESVQRMQQRDQHNPASPTTLDSSLRQPEPESVSECSSSSRSVLTRSTVPDEVFSRVRLSSSTSGLDDPRVPTLPTVYQPPPNMMQSFYYSKSSGFSSALHGLLSVVGTHLPGEYGVDKVAFREDSQSIRSNLHKVQCEEEKKDGANSPQKGPGSSAIPPHFVAPPPLEVVFNLLDKHQFRDYRPATFRKLRRIAGLTDELYLHIISQPTRERLAEGGSGAFFFVCGNGDFIVKTVKKSEARTLLGVLDQYYDHLLAHPDSFLVRFFGLHAINMYGNDFTFVVMKNVFPPGIQLNETYDLKGSWVNRNASVRAPGKLATCRHCHEPFIDGSHDKCAVVIGEHEPSMTLKDNDMICKIRLYPHHAYEVIDTLYHDSDALCAMGLTDYSLLVGVQHARYDVEMLRSQASLQPGEEVEVLTRKGEGERKIRQEYEGISYMQKYPARIVIAPQDYFFGVIDILETWSWEKKMERWFKVYILGQDHAGVSCMNPEDFKTRFQKKIAQIIEHAVFAREVTGSWKGKRDVGNPFSLINSQ